MLIKGLIVFLFWWRRVLRVSQICVKLSILEIERHEQSLSNNAASRNHTSVGKIPLRLHIVGNNLLPYVHYQYVNIKPLQWPLHCPTIYRAISELAQGSALDMAYLQVAGQNVRITKTKDMCRALYGSQRQRIWVLSLNIVSTIPYKRVLPFHKTLS